jgi:hypothetical protein
MARAYKRYEFQVCSVATYAFENWVHTNTWLDGALATRIQMLFPEIWSDVGVNGQVMRAGGRTGGYTSRRMPGTHQYSTGTKVLAFGTVT